jgi:LCP family protein required for cell wall assembly
MAEDTSPSPGDLAGAFDYGAGDDPGTPLDGDGPAAGAHGSPATGVTGSGSNGSGGNGSGSTGSGSTGSGDGPRRRWRRWGLGAVAVVVALALVAVGGFVVVNNKFNLIDRIGDADLDVAVDGAPRNYLLIGSDSREGIDPDDPRAAVFMAAGQGGPSGQRADAIMILRIDPGQGTVDVLSVPRDLWVPIAGTGGEERINSAYTAGPQQMIDTIRQDFDIQIHHYIEVDFKGFKDLVDSVDGVSMWFDRPVRDLNSGLDVADVGCVRLDGYQALAFVRARYFEEQGDLGWQSDPTGDLGRMARQQLFVRRVAQRVADDFSITDVRGLNSLADVAANNVIIDNRMNLRQSVALARWFSSVDDEAINFYSLPTERWFTPGGADVQLLEPFAAEEILQLFRDEQPDADDVSRQRLVPVVVLNGSGVEGQAAGAAETLASVGFTVADTGNAGATYERTVVRHAPGAEATAIRLARHIEGGAGLEEDDGLPPGSVIVVLGPDFTSVLTEPLDPNDPVLLGLPGFAPAPADTRVSAGGEAATGEVAGGEADEAAGGEAAGAAEGGAAAGDGGDETKPKKRAKPKPKPTTPEAVLTPGQPPEGQECA